MWQKLIAIVLACCLVPAGYSADRATVIQMPNNGPMLVLVYTSSGQVLPIIDVTFLKLDAPPPNPQEGLAVNLVVVRDQTQATTKTVSILLDLQVKYQKGTKPEMHLLDRTATDRLSKAYVKLKEEEDKKLQRDLDAGFPYYFLVDAGGKVLEQGTLLGTTEAMVKQVEKFSKGASNAQQDK